MPTENIVIAHVYTLSELRTHGTANRSAESLTRRASYNYTVVDSLRESIPALRCGFLCLQGTQSKQIRSRSEPAYSVERVYRCAPLIDGLGHATRSATVPVCRS